MAKKKEELLSKKREAERRRRERIKNDPILWKEQQEKQKVLNKKKFEKGQLKLVADMTVREHQPKKKEWRKNSNAYYQRKKGDLGDISIPGCSNALSQSASLQNQHLQMLRKKKRKRNREKIVREKEKFKDQIVVLKRTINTLRKREHHRRNEVLSTQNEFLSPQSKVRKLMKEGDSKIIAKKLLFGEMTKENLASSYKEMKSYAEKLIVRRILTRNRKVLKKYRLIQFNSISSKILSKARVKRTRKSFHDLRIAETVIGIHQVVVSFVERDNISKMCPGKKAFVSFKKFKKQKRILLGTWKSTYEKFCESEKNFKISFTTFWRYKPFWVVLPKVGDRDTCACKVHTNIEHLVTVLFKANAIVT